MNDLIYRWKDNNPVQLVANLSLPGGFKMDDYDNESCDVKTATGKQGLKCYFVYQKMSTRKRNLNIHFRVLVFW